MRDDRSEEEAAPTVPVSEAPGSPGTAANGEADADPTAPADALAGPAPAGIRAGIDWPWCAALLLVLPALTLHVTWRVCPADEPGIFAAAWATSLFSTWQVLIVLLALGLVSRRRPWLRPVAGLVLFAAIVWSSASLQVFLTQGHHLTWDALVHEYSDATSMRVFAAEMLRARTLLVAAALGGGLIGLHAGLRRLPPRSAPALVGGLVLLTLAPGGAVAAGVAGPGGPFLDLYGRPASMPWSPFQARVMIARAADAEQARELWCSAEDPRWAPGPDPVLARVAGRYPRRGVVFVLLESHRLSDVDELGRGAHAHRPSSPFIGGRLADRAIVIENLLQSGPQTASSAWALLSSSEYLPGCNGVPALLDLGRARQLRDRGYHLEWLKSAGFGFSDLRALTSAVGVIEGPTDAEKDELRARDDSLWTSWGMPDEQLFEVAARRVERLVAEDRPFFLVAQTVSNHLPFRLPDAIDGAPLTEDFRGGMRYADACVQGLVERIDRLPEDRRPIVIVTADTAHRDWLEDARPLYRENLEALRLPGLVLLPDGFLAGERVASPFSHADWLDLVAVAAGVPPPEHAAFEKLTDRHRVASVAARQGREPVVFTPGLLRHGADGRYYRVRGRWALEPADVEPPAAERALVDRTLEFVRRKRRLVWPGLSWSAR